MADYIVVPIADAQLAREALGRLYATANNSPYPIPGNPPREDHYGETLWYVDPRSSADETQAGLGPSDEFLDTCLGQTAECYSGNYTIPSAYESIDEETWFLPY